MTKRVNASASKQNLTGFPKVVKNLFSESFGDWNNSTIGDGTFTPGTDNKDATLTTTSSGRAFASNTVDFKAGRHYICGANFSSLSGTPANDTVKMFGLDPVISGIDEVTTTSNGAWACYFTPSIDETISVRIGLGCSSNESQALSVVIDQPFCYELDALPTLGSTRVPGPCDTDDTAGFLAGQAYATTFPYTIAASGAMTDNQGGLVYSDANLDRFCVGYFIGDSYANQTNEWPTKLAEISERLVLIGHAVSGQSINTVVTSSIHTDLMDNSNYTYSGTALPEFIIIQTSVNDFATDVRTADQVIDDLTTIIDAAIARQIYPIITDVAAISTNASAAEEEEMAKFNYRVKSFAKAKNVGFLSLYNILSESDKPNRHAPAYFRPTDVTHPNEAGAEAIAAAMRDLLDSLRR